MSNIQFLSVGSADSFHGAWDDVRLAVHGQFLVFVGHVTTEEGVEFVQARALEVDISGKYGPSVEVSNPDDGGDSAAEKMLRRDAEAAERAVEAAYEAEFA